jgi:hypothetical protein
LGQIFLSFAKENSKSHQKTNIIEEVATNILSLFLKIQKKMIQALKLFTEIIKMVSIYKSNYNAQKRGLGAETKWSN